MPLNAAAIFPSSDPEFVSFKTRRSVVHSANGMIACTQPLAAEAGQAILRAGGNAADAAVAVAAGLNVTEPSSTGLGGDMFCLFYNSKTKKVESLNGSGRSPGTAPMSEIKERMQAKHRKAEAIGMFDIEAVTVPGAPAGWIDTVERFGNKALRFGNKVLSMEQILEPAINLADSGFPVSELASSFWRASESNIKHYSGITASKGTASELLKEDEQAPEGLRAPRPGELFRNPALAESLRALAKDGKDAFYTGRIARSIVNAVNSRGGYLSMKDLQHHLQCTRDEAADNSQITADGRRPISLIFNGHNIGSTESKGLDGQVSQTANKNGVEIWEHPPNGQGAVALMALGILEELERTNKIPTFRESDHNSAAYLHAVIEALRIAFADGTWYITDPEESSVPTSALLSRQYLASRAKLFDPDKASISIPHGNPLQNHSDTVYFAVTDKWGNACSFINSTYGGFGCCVIPKGTGFTLQNRGANFSLDPNHPNVYAPRKRPYHTIIPAMVTNPEDGSLHTVYGVMGGFMQPQGHVQVLLNMLVFKYNPQAALDAPRFCIGAGTPEQGKVLDTVFLEEGIDESVAKELHRMGHEVEIITGFRRGLFGRGQVIRCHVEEGRQIFSAGSDPRGDGGAFPVGGPAISH